MISKNKNMICIVVCPNTYKSSLTASVAARAMKQGISRVYNCDYSDTNKMDNRPLCKIISIPLADGGDGTAEALIDNVGGTFHTTRVRGPLGKSVMAKWGRLGGKDADTAVIEMAEASGLRLLHKSEYDPLHASTYGVGQLIKSAVEAGCTRIVVGIGGSATNDGGAGMAQALGVRLLDSDGRDLPPGGAALQNLKCIDVSASILTTNIAFTAACDVNNPLCGPLGASAIFGPQKGSNSEMVETLDYALNSYSKVIERDLGIALADIPGSGAAGGLGAGLMAFCGARLVSGVDLVLDLVRFDDKLRDVDLIVTGEGRLDTQTAMGKVIAGVARRAKIKNIPVIALVGSIEEGAEAALISEGLNAALSITDGPLLLEDAVKDAYRLLTDTSERVARLLSIRL